ncbi:MAG: TrkA family potassium uptake protein [Muribaculaceae bacterium]|nr:TrkA family potassium uptake protein [Muribaculaceae bacterium]
MRYLIIGLGIYGSNLAIDLTKMGNEVIGADKDPSLVESIKDFISTAYIIDSTDEVSLGVLPLKNVDLVIVAIGENFGASIRTVALLKKLGVPHIYARAIDKLHESILESFNLDRIITPEQRAAADLVNEMALGTDTQSLRIDSTHHVLKFRVPEFLVGLRYDTLPLAKDYDMQLVAVCRKEQKRNIMGIEHAQYELVDIIDDDTDAGRVLSGDYITCLGTDAAFRNLLRKNS